MTNTANLHTEDSFYDEMLKYGEGYHFPTYSTYVGSFDSTRHVMNGYGVYTYPDGSTYTGQFVNGLFEGPGKLQLTHPYNTLFRGEFMSGKMVRLDGIEFIDSLLVEADIEGKHLNFNKWLYCNTMDRRFFIEHIHNIKPVGPTTLLTARVVPRDLKVTAYDVEEGIYDTRTGTISLREPPFSRTLYVGCPHRQRWIQRHCRAGNLVSFPRSYGTYILHTNITNEQPLCSHVDKCVCEFPFEKEFSRPICQMCAKALESSSADDIADLLGISKPEIDNTVPEAKSSLSISDRYSVLMTTTDLMTESDRQTESQSDPDPVLERMTTSCQEKGPLYEEISTFKYDWNIHECKKCDIKINPLHSSLANWYHRFSDSK